MAAAPSPDIATGLHPDVLFHHDPPRIEGMPEVLQLEKLGKIVGFYDKQREQRKDPTTGTIDEDRFLEEMKQTIDRLLEGEGYSLDTATQTDTEKADLELARTVLLRAMQSSPDEWRGHSTGDGHHDGVKNQVFRQLLDRYQFPTVTSSDPLPKPPPENELQDRIREHKDQLETAQLAYSRKLAERSKRMGLFERPRTIAEMAAARKEIAGYIETLSAEMMQDFEAQGIPYEKRIDMVGAFIDAEMAATIEGMEAVRADDFRNRNKLVQRGLETWASWATPTVEREENESRAHHFGRSVLKSITTLNTWKKGAVFFALGAGTGALMVPLAGLVGGSAFIAGGATLLARQIARGLAGAKLDSVAGAKTIAERQANEMLNDIADASVLDDETTHNDLLELAEKMAEGYRKHNRNRLLGGMGISLVVGGGVGSLINNFLDLNAAYGKAHELIQTIFGHGGQQTPHVPTPSSSGSAGGGTGGHGGVVGGEIPSDKPDIGGAHHPEVDRGDEIKEFIKDHAAARRIDGGEGWLQTFKELGMSPSERRAFLEQYGDDLLKKFPKVTFEMENGEPGILMTKNGKMPDEVLKYIVDRAEARGYIHVESGVEVQSEPVVISSTEQAANHLVDSHELVPANTVGKGETFTQTLNELKKAGVIDISREDYNSLLRTVGPRLAKIEYPDGTPVAYPNRFPPHDWRLNRSPSGRLHAKAIRLIERVAREHAYGKAA